LPYYRPVCPPIVFRSALKSLQLRKVDMMQAQRLVVIEANDRMRQQIVEFIEMSKLPVTLISAIATYPAGTGVFTHADLLLLDDSETPINTVSRRIGQLHQQHPQLDVIIFSQQLNRFYVKHLVGRGISGYIYKGEQLDIVLPAGLRLIAQGEFYVSPRVGALTYLAPSDVQNGLNTTDREVLWLIAQGQAVQQIAMTLDLTTRSVYRARARLRSVLNVQTNELIVDAARTQGLLDPPTERRR